MPLYINFKSFLLCLFIYTSLRDSTFLSKYISPVICRFFSAFDVADHGTREDTRSAAAMKLIINGNTIATARSVHKNSSVRYRQATRCLPVCAPREDQPLHRPRLSVLAFNDPIYQLSPSRAALFCIGNPRSPAQKGAGGERGFSSCEVGD